MKQKHLIDKIKRPGALPPLFPYTPQEAPSFVGEPISREQLKAFECLLIRWSTKGPQPLNKMSNYRNLARVLF